jgi:hypothetical protein
VVTDIAHVVYGFITSYTSFFNPVLSTFFFISYLVYQLFDYLGEQDISEMKEDIVEYAIGLAVGLAVLII